MAFNNQTRPTEVAKQQEKQKACERPNMEKVCGVGCHMITEKKNNAWREEEGVWVGGGMHWMRWGGLVAPWECLATPTTFSRSCRSRWRPVISVLSLSSEGPDNQWALLGEAGANPLTPHPTPPPSADACVCVYAHGRGTQSQNACVCISGGCRGVWAHKWKAWIFLCCLHSCKTAYSQRDEHSINEDRLGKRRRQADNKEAFIVIW